MNLLPDLRDMAQRGEDFLYFKHMQGHAPHHTLLMEMLLAKRNDSVSKNPQWLIWIPIKIKWLQQPLPSRELPVNIDLVLLSRAPTARPPARRPPEEARARPPCVTPEARMPECHGVNATDDDYYSYYLLRVCAAAVYVREERQRELKERKKKTLHI